jgi:hypothetical protein
MPRRTKGARAGGKKMYTVKSQTRAQYPYYTTVKTDSYREVIEMLKVFREKDSGFTGWRVDYNGEMCVDEIKAIQTA